MREYFRHTGGGQSHRRAICRQGPVARPHGAAGHRAVRPPGGRRHSRRAGGRAGHAGRLGIAPRRPDGHHATWSTWRTSTISRSRPARGKPSAVTSATCRRPCLRRRLAGTSSRCSAIRPGSAPLLRDLHDAHLLERFIPEFRHARGLLQFNQYHKYTVDEHCLRAVEFATELWCRSGAAGPRLPPAEPKALAAPGPVAARSRQGISGRSSGDGGADRHRRRQAVGTCRRTRPRRCDSWSTSTC